MGSGDRSRGGEPLSVCGDGGLGRRAGRLHREYRYRGPALIRAAAKNHGFVAVVTDPGDYAAVMDEMAGAGGATSPALRERLARAAFAHTAAYDAAIAGWMNREAKEDFPALLTWRRGIGRACAMARTRISRRRSMRPSSRGRRAAGHRHGDAAAGQGAQLQQPQRHRRGLRAGGGNSSGRPSPSSSTPIPAAWPRRHDLATAYRRGAGLRPHERLSAASSR